MKTTAAILVEPGRPLELADLDVPALKPGQVLVEVAFCGVCHTQILETRPPRRRPLLPALPRPRGQRNRARGLARRPA